MDSYRITTCNVTDCQENVAVIVSKKFPSNNGSNEILFGYCQFHSIIAESYFGSTPNRKELKGIRP